VGSAFESGSTIVSRQAAANHARGSAGFRYRWKRKVRPQHLALNRAAQQWTEPNVAGNHPAAIGESNEEHKEIAVSESAQIIEALKRSLKTRGLTYRDLAAKVGLSEASIKRVFSEETFTLQRLEAICAAIGMSMSELVKITADSREPRAQFLSLEQEQLLASSTRLLACFYLLLNGRSSQEIAARLALSERELRELYVKLDAARLIELLPRLKTRLRVGPVISWRSDGPVHRVYEKQVKAEFLQSEFQAAQEALHFRSAELSEASAKILLRKSEQLAKDFAELAALDVAVPTSEKHNVALLVAFRPWIFSMFSGLGAKK
jgi:DNA-binding Xre family transcriptional regulator